MSHIDSLARQINRFCINHDGSVTHDNTLDRLLAEFDDELAIYAAESGADREFDYCPDRFRDMVLDRNS